MGNAGRALSVYQSHEETLGDELGRHCQKILQLSVAWMLRRWRGSAGVRTGPDGSVNCCSGAAPQGPHSNNISLGKLGSRPYHWPRLYYQIIFSKCPRTRTNSYSKFTAKMILIWSTKMCILLLKWRVTSVAILAICKAKWFRNSCILQIWLHCWEVILVPYLTILNVKVHLYLKNSSSTCHCLLNSPICLNYPYILNN